MNRGLRVLVIDHDPGIRTLLRRVLAAAGYLVQVMEPGQQVLGGITERKFDLLILDIDVSANAGHDVIRDVRRMSAFPILALSVRSDDDFIAGALDSGADDYVRKPFSDKEFLARVKNALRRRARQRGKPAQVVTGDFEIDLLHRRVNLHGNEVHIPPKAYEVLRVLAESAGKVLTHKQIVRALWRTRKAYQLQYLRNLIRELRRKLEPDPAHPQYILTETRVGYRLEARRRGASEVQRLP